MSDQVFPTISNQPAWSRFRTPGFVTVVQKSVSGREVRAAMMQTPIYTWTLNFSLLKDTGPSGPLQTMEGFFLQRQGMADSFLFDDPTDDSVTGQGLGTGDGTTTSFSLVRSYGGFAEQIDALNALSNVYVAGVAQAPSAYSVQNATAYPSVLFSAAPASGAAITADFTYYFRVRFGDDSYDFEEFLYQFHRLGKLTLTRAKL